MRQATNGLAVLAIAVGAVSCASTSAGQSSPLPAHPEVAASTTQADLPAASAAASSSTPATPATSSPSAASTSSPTYQSVSFGDTFTTPLMNRVVGANLQYGADGAFTIASWQVYAGASGYVVRSADFFLVDDQLHREYAQVQDNGEVIPAGEGRDINATFPHLVSRSDRLAYALGGPLTAVWEGNNFNDNNPNVVKPIDSYLSTGSTATPDAGSAGCTTTRSGSCIQGGEFCPAANEGTDGTDAAGDTYVCQDSNGNGHPHWELP